MKALFTKTLILSLILAVACKNKSMKNIASKAPLAEKQPTTLKLHNDVRIDNYFWMRLSDEQKLAEVKDEQTKKVIRYLEEENTYHDQITASSLPFEEQLFEEMKGRIKEDDSSVPYKDNGYFYTTRFEIGMQYPIYSRQKDNLKATDQSRSIRQKVKKLPLSLLRPIVH